MSVNSGDNTRSSRSEVMLGTSSSLQCWTNSTKSIIFGDSTKSASNGLSVPTIGELGPNMSSRSNGAVSIVGNDEKLDSPAWWRVSPFSEEAFLNLVALEGLLRSSKGSLCFPRDGNFGAERDRTSFVGKTEDAHPRLSSSQALEAALYDNQTSIVLLLFH